MTSEEMLETVTEPHWPTYWAVRKELLKSYGLEDMILSPDVEEIVISAAASAANQVGWFSHFLRKHLESGHPDFPPVIPKPGTVEKDQAAKFFDKDDQGNYRFPIGLLAS